jgi:predicted ATPase
MLTQLRLSNFKAWSQPDPIALKPVTMLLGTNSSGKSSLIQSLLLLKQTVQSPDCWRRPKTEPLLMGVPI